MPYLRQQFSALLGNTSSIVKFICCIITFGYCLSYFDKTLELLALTPGYLVSLDIWKILTFWFLELHILDVLVDLVTVGLCGKLIEPLWGPLEMLKFFVITNLGVAILSCLYYFFLFSITQNTDILFDTHIHGLVGYIAGVCVAVRQIMPDHLIIKTGIGKFTNRNIPLTILCISIILWAVGLLDGIHPVMFCSGLIVSWVYLRFYQKHSNNSRGDSAENFSFAR
jgi:membrane associated rhomboid family serine protease